MNSIAEYVSEGILIKNKYWILTKALLATLLSTGECFYYLLPTKINSLHDFHLKQQYKQ